MTTKREATKVMTSQTVCVWCGEPLRFERGRGWVHQDGSVYKQRIEKTERHPEGELVDDHCVLPRRS
jgi:hypothetical protein